MEGLKLPEAFELSMQRLFKGDYPAFRDSLFELPYSGISVRPGADMELVAKEANAGRPLLPVPWNPYGYYLENADAAAKSFLHYAGAYYIQEPSAQAPAACLPIGRGGRVLDLCAAPGGKSAQLLSKLGGTGFLLSNDVSAGRAAALKRNLQRRGAVRAAVSVESPERLAARLSGFFDAVLADLPCSGEGMFRRKPSMAARWEEEGPACYVPLQREILKNAAAMVKEGGFLLFSTCTFSAEENEENAEWLLEEFPELKPVKLAFGDHFSKGFSENASLSGRIYPAIGGEGQFLSLFVKRSKEGSGAEGAAASAGRTDAAANPAEGFKGMTLKEAGGLLHLVPPEDARLKGFRCLMTGLCIGEEKKGRIAPSQALAHALGAEEWPQRLKLAAGDERIARYLRGESIEFEKSEISAGELPSFLPKEIDQRTVLVSAAGHPLGFALQNGGILKNRIESGWRML